MASLQSTKMIVEEQHVITLTYDLRDTDAKGEMLERTDAEDPFTFYSVWANCSPPLKPSCAD